MKFIKRNGLYVPKKKPEHYMGCMGIEDQFPPNWGPGLGGKRSILKGGTGGMMGGGVLSSASSAPTIDAVYKGLIGWDNHVHCNLTGVTAGKTLVIFAAYSSETITVSSIITNQAQTPTLVTTSKHIGGGECLLLYHLYNVSASTTDITLTVSASCSLSIIVYEVSNITTQDEDGIADGFGTNADTGSVTNDTSASAIFFAAMTTTQGGAWTGHAINAAGSVPATWVQSDADQVNTDNVTFYGLSTVYYIASDKVSRKHEWTNAEFSWVTIIGVYH